MFWFSGVFDFLVFWILGFLDFWLKIRFWFLHFRFFDFLRQFFDDPNQFFEDPNQFFSEPRQKRIMDHENVHEWSSSKNGVPIVLVRNPNKKKLADRFWIRVLRVEFGRQICDQIGPEKTLDLAAQKMVWLARKLVWEPKKPKN